MSRPRFRNALRQMVNRQYERTYGRDAAIDREIRFQAQDESQERFNAEPEAENRNEALKGQDQ
jgi:hypothetical protein